MKKKAVIGLGFLFFTGLANGGVLTGDTITSNAFFTPATAVVGSGVEFTNSLFGTDTWTADFDDNYFTLGVSTTSNIGGADGFEWVFNDLDFSDGGYISNVELVSFIGSSFVDPTGISFTDHSVAYTMDRLSLGSFPQEKETSGTFKITTSAVVSVPEPSTIMLFGMGLIGLALSRKRSAS